MITRFTVRMKTDLLDLAKVAVLRTPGITLSGLIQAGLSYEISKLESKRGRKFTPPKTHIRLSPGRPRGS